MTIPLTKQINIPADGVTRDDLVCWDEEFQDICARLRPLFYRPEPHTHAQHYLRTDVVFGRDNDQ